MSIVSDDLVYHESTSHGYRYFFHPKHHGAGSRTDACWRPQISRSDEFEIFRDAANRELSDEAGNLYGLRNDSRGGVWDLGTRGEQLALFWNPPEGSPWHGFPCWAIMTKDSLNRKGQQYKPPKSIFEKLHKQRILTASQCKRLSKGDCI